MNLSSNGTEHSPGVSHGSNLTAALTSRRHYIIYQLTPITRSDCSTALLTSRLSSHCCSPSDPTLTSPVPQRSQTCTFSHFTLVLRVTRLPQLEFDWHQSPCDKSSKKGKSCFSETTVCFKKVDMLYVISYEWPGSKAFSYIPCSLYELHAIGLTDLNFLRERRPRFQSKRPDLGPE